jgi:molybdopterin synthase catalytic subunit
MTIIIQDSDFRADEVTDRYMSVDGRSGAIVCFTGVVRQDDDGSLVSMTLEHYPAMAQSALEQIEAVACDRFDVHEIVILHRFGRMVPGDRIMMVATSSAHRVEAFRAAEFLMDYLKTDAPFWKQEERTSGMQWVGSREIDEDRRGAWT